MRLGRGKPVSKGPGAWPVDDTICTGFTLKPADTLALAVMVEKDEGIDVVSSEIESIRSTMAWALETHRQAGYRAARRIVLTGKAELAIVKFKGGGGQNNARYAQA